MNKWVLMFASRRELADTSVRVCQENERLRQENAALKRQSQERDNALYKTVLVERAKADKAARRARDLEEFLSVINPGEVTP